MVCRPEGDKPYLEPSRDNRGRGSRRARVPGSRLGYDLRRRRDGYRVTTGLDHDPHRLAELARQARVLTIKELYAAQSGHPGSSLSGMDVFVALYHGGFLRHRPDDPMWPDRDYFILSNGHAVPGLYACLALAGYGPLDELTTLRRLGSRLAGHAKRGSYPGIEVSSGSLGQGLGVGLGIVLGMRTTDRDNRVVVMMSDGEQQEGSTWESVMFAGSRQLPVLAIVDQNRNQINGPTHEIMPIMDELPPKYSAFGWTVIETDGNDMGAVTRALHEGLNVAETGPAVIVSHTTTGKGVSFMEGDFHWHHGVLTDDKFRQAMHDLGEPVSPEPDETWLPREAERPSLAMRGA